MKLLDIFSASEGDFYGDKDDTLFNRLCTLVLCQNTFHDELFEDISTNCDSVLLSFFRRISCVCSYQANNDLQLLKIAVVIFFKYGAQLCADTLSEVLHIFMDCCFSSDPHVFLVLLEATCYFLDSSCSLNDLKILDAVFAERICDLLLKKLDKQTNVHQRKRLLKLFAHLTVYNGTHDETVSDNRIIKAFLPYLSPLSDTGQSYLINVFDVTRKFSTHMLPIALDSLISLEDTERLVSNTDSSVRVLYLLCVKEITFTSLDPSKVIALFAVHPQFSKICARVVAMGVRSESLSMCSELWTHLLSVWLNAVSGSLYVAHATKLHQLVQPVWDAVRGSRKLSTAVICTCPHLLEQIISELLPNADAVDSPEMNTYHVTLLNLLCIFTGSHIPHELATNWLQTVWGRLCFLAKKPIHLSSLLELKALVDFSSRLIFLLSVQNSEQSVSTFLRNLLTHVRVCENSVISSVFTHAFVVIMGVVKSCRNFPNNVQLILIDSLHSFICSQDFSVDLDTTEMDLSFWNRKTLLASLLNLFFHENALTIEWSSEMVEPFCKFMTAISLHYELLLSNGEAYGLLLCLLVSFVMFRFSNCPSEKTVTVSGYSDKWLLDNTAQLLHLEPSILVESKLVLHILCNLCRELNQVSKTDASNSDLNTLVSLVQKELTAAFGINFLSDSPPSADLPCPSCGESSKQLLEDILINHPGTMTVDCSEG
ncbi:hypothetical protein EG68_09254 [Paragonimus skrjabini miyazakii]|uniref:Uncharacterized protein n=1 Tax=Paragonimus skrjabini miyazakii TaxID=59628 RepID=A0A8S9YMX9_9TREM|nr:hypothetical protein EG68_09254 [Paragonimus skrjabini miyazakii]